MSDRYFSITFPEGLIKEPVIYALVKRYRLRTNIFRALVSGSSSWVAISLSGDDERIDNALLDLKCRGAIVMEGGTEVIDITDAPTVSGIKIRLTVPEQLVKTPVLSDLITEHDVVVDIRQAKIDSSIGVIDVELTGGLDAIDKAIESIKGKGIRVDAIEGNVIE